MKYLLKTKLDELDEKDFELINQYLLNSCKLFMGKKKFNPKITLMYSDSKNFGEYVFSTKELKIWVNTCKTLKEYITTFIHEYTHHTQKYLTQKYKPSEKDEDHLKNPFEIEAYTNEKRYLSLVWNGIKKDINRK